MRQETQADSFATHWVLDKASNGLQREFRILTITVSLSWILVHERFQEAVANFGVSDRSVGLESAAYMLKALFEPTLTPPPHASASEAFNWACGRVAIRFAADRRPPRRTA